MRADQEVSVLHRRRLKKVVVEADSDLNSKEKGEERCKVEEGGLISHRRQPLRAAGGIVPNWDN